MEFVFNYFNHITADSYSCRFDEIAYKGDAVAYWLDLLLFGVKRHMKMSGEKLILSLAVIILVLELSRITKSST